MDQRALRCFQCSSTSRNSQNRPTDTHNDACRAAFSALLRAEIPKICCAPRQPSRYPVLSVLFYEPKFPKSKKPANLTPDQIFQCSSTSRNSQNHPQRRQLCHCRAFSALLRAEIPKMRAVCRPPRRSHRFQCSSTSRNSQNRYNEDLAALAADFQCSSTSRNSQNGA